MTVQVASTCVWFPSGNRLDTTNPNPKDWTDDDLATMMATATMWSGVSRWEHPLSLAQHSIAVLAVRELQEKGPLQPHKALRELLQDAARGLLGLCSIPAVQAILRDALGEITEAVDQAVRTRYVLPGWQLAEMRRRSSAETFVTANEAFHVLGMPRDEATKLFRSSPFNVDPIARMERGLPAGMTEWQPWPRDVAKKVFLEMLLCLQAEAREAFSPVATGRILRARDEATGAPLPDTPVRVVGPDGCTAFEGIVVSGKRDENGWDLDGTFVIATTDSTPNELISINGWNCDVELL